MKKEDIIKQKIDAYKADIRQLEEELQELNIPFVTKEEMFQLGFKPISTNRYNKTKYTSEWSVEISPIDYGRVVIRKLSYNYPTFDFTIETKEDFIKLLKQLGII